MVIKQGVKTIEQVNYIVLTGTPKVKQAFDFREKCRQNGLKLTMGHKRLFYKKKIGERAKNTSLNTEYPGNFYTLNSQDGSVDGVENVIGICSKYGFKVSGLVVENNNIESYDFYTKSGMKVSGAGALVMGIVRDSIFNITRMKEASESK